MCNESLLNFNTNPSKRRPEYTGIPSVFRPDRTKNEIPQPVVNIFSKIRMLRAGKLSFESGSVYVGVFKEISKFVKHFRMLMVYI